MIRLHGAAALAIFASLVSNASAAVLYSGGNPDKTGQSISIQPWNYYYSSGYWSRPYVNVSITSGDQWTVSGIEFYEATQVTLPITTATWDIRTTISGISGSPFAGGTSTNISTIDTGTQMTGTYNGYNIHKVTVTFNAPVVLAGGQTYYFSAMLDRYTSPYVTNSLNAMIVYSNDTGQIGSPINDGTAIWTKLQGWPASLSTLNHELAFNVIGTSVLPVPEPASISLLAVSGFLLLRRRK